MKKNWFLVFIFFLLFNFTLAQTNQDSFNLLNQAFNYLQKIIQNLSNEFMSAQIYSVPLPRGVKPLISPALPITLETLKSILPDEDKKNDYIVQLNNFKITRIINNPTSDIKAVFFIARDIGWKCVMYESEEDLISRSCSWKIKNRVVTRELAIKITDDTVLLSKNRKKINLSNFKVGDKINVYGFMDKNNYGIEALIIRKIAEASISQKQLPQLCVQVITPAKNPQTGECKEFPTPCDVPAGWIRVEKCTPSIAPSIKVISPNGGEVWEIGKTYTIRWETQGVSYDAPAIILLRDIRYERGFILGTAKIADTSNTGVYNFTVPSQLQNMTLGSGKVYKIEVCVAGPNSNKGPNICDESDEVFSIVSSLKIISPKGGEVWESDKPQTIRWISYGIKGNIRIYLVHKETGYACFIGRTNALNESYTVILQAHTNCENHSFPKLISGQYKVLIDTAEATGAGLASYESEGYITLEVKTPYIRVLSPNGGELLQEGSEFKIKWEALNLPSDARINITLLRDDGANMHIVSDLPYYLREYNWGVTTKGSWSKACLAKGTKVLMKDGTYKKIEEIREGDYVVSYNLTNKKFTFSKVIKILKRQDPIVIINQKLRASLDHLIFTNKGFKQAKDIKINDLILTEKGKFEKVFSIKQEPGKEVETYDLILEGNQNFFAEGYLVHSAPKPLKDLEDNANPSILKKTLNFLKEIFGIKQAKAVNGYYRYKVRVSATWGTFDTPYYGYIYDESNDWFKITEAKLTKVISPNGGEVWEIGKTYTIRWDPGIFPSNAKVRIELEETRYHPEICGKSERIIETTNTGSYNWTIPNQLGCIKLGVGNIYRIRIYINSDKDSGADESDTTFSIVSPTTSIRVISPNGGEVWEIGKTYTIRWDPGIFPSDIETEITLHEVKDHPEVCEKGERIIKTTNTGSYNWTIPNQLGCIKLGVGNIYKIEVCIVDPNSGKNPICDGSDETFSIVPPTASIKVISPNGGEVWNFGESQTIARTIKWVSYGISNNVNIVLFKKNDFTPGCLIGSADALSGSYTVTLRLNQECPNNPSFKITPGDYKVLIYGIPIVGGGFVGDDSDDYFSIVAPNP